MDAHAEGNTVIKTVLVKLRSATQILHAIEHEHHDSVDDHARRWAIHNAGKLVPIIPEPLRQEDFPELSGFCNGRVFRRADNDTLLCEHIAEIGD